jgi:hypothetical protein
MISEKNDSASNDASGKTEQHVGAVLRDRAAEKHRKHSNTCEQAICQAGEEARRHTIHMALLPWCYRAL